MILPLVHELSVLAIADRGIPNRERIILRPTELVNLMQFVVTIALRSDGGMVRPLNDQIFWFPERVVVPPSWITLYTGPGIPTETVDPETGQPTYTFHWGKPHTILLDPNYVAVVLGLRSILIPSLEPTPPPAPASPPAPPPVG